jgi:hypothetical protein
VAVAALLLWLCTATIGSYLLVTAIRAGNRDQEARPAEPVSVPAAPAATPASARSRDIFAPQSLRQAQSEPIASLRDVAEFSHPALAMIGIGFWLGYVVSRERLFAAIGLGILLGTICAGVSWYLVNQRDAAEPGSERNRAQRLTASPRVLILHGAGAALTLLIAVLIVAGV